MSTRTYLSIGDVLTLLRQEFPDITISKIRFLESQGLVDPERSPSGYRKFYEHDVERLRWVLRQQREHFLPLKVIRDRLARSGDISTDMEDFEPGSAEEADEATFEPGSEEELEIEPETEIEVLAVGSYELEEEEEAVVERWVEPAPEPRAATLATASPLSPRPAAVRTAPVVAPEPEPEPVAAAPAPSSEEPPEPAGGPRHARPPVVEPPRAVHLSGASLTLEELCAASGLAASEVAAVESFGLIEPMVVGGSLYYDEDCLTVAKLVADFARFGIEPRHLRLFRNGADRELGLIEQVVTPLLRQRNPEARQRALDAAEELSRLGQSLRSAIVRRSLRHHFGS